MRAPDVYPVEPLERAMGWYALVGILALALSLAGVMGGHHLLGAAFGTGEADEALALPPADAAECPPARQAADACDYDGDSTSRRADASACGAVHQPGVPATPVRGAGAPTTTGGR